ncbi:hypothetical protein ACIBH1_45080 [Nonomuraea sp. NPDC050663]|uniref:hypothetical protein n=1 Tax=Nonomuraea sp. NPDC050663 TaxID=3364370 RepID=UPI0037A82128
MGPKQQGKLNIAAVAKPVTVGAATLAPTGLALLHPIGVVVVCVELALVIVIIGCLLFGSDETVERIFRLLRWIANRPEPPAPRGGKR